METLVFPFEAVPAGDIGATVANLYAIPTRLDVAIDLPPEKTGPGWLRPAAVRAVGRLFAMARPGDNPSSEIEPRFAAKLNDLLVLRHILAELSGEK